MKSKMFATTFVGYLDLAGGGLRFASGGHNPPLIYRAAAGRCEAITSTGVAVGLFKGADFAGAAARLEPGDVLVLYTDGITEAINGDEDEFGEERLETLIVKHADLPAQALADLIMETIIAFAGDEELFDDATLVVVKRTA